MTNKMINLNNLAIIDTAHATSSSLMSKIVNLLNVNSNNSLVSQNSSSSDSSLPKIQFNQKIRSHRLAGKSLEESKKQAPK